LKILVCLASEVLIFLGVFIVVCMTLGVNKNLPPGPMADTYVIIVLVFSLLTPALLILTRVIIFNKKDDVKVTKGESIRTESKWKTYVEALCEHLRQIGLDVTVESKPPPIGFWKSSSPFVIYGLIFELLLIGWLCLLLSAETLWMGVGVLILGGLTLAFFNPQSDYFLTLLDLPFTGSIRVANRNIDLIELEKLNKHALIREKFSGIMVYAPYVRVLYLDIYRCNYIVQAKVDGLEDKLKAKAKPVTVQKDPKSWEVVGITWEGGELAQILNSDSNLRDTLSHMKDSVFSFLEISPDRILERVRIGPTGAAYGSPKSAFPTVETFEAYDRIASHVRSIARIPSEKFSVSY